MTIAAPNLNKTGPTWLRMRRMHGAPSAFLRDPRRGCLNQRDIFYSDELSDQVVAKSICARCVCFKDCTAWALYSDECDTDFLIVAGMDPNTRLKIREGREDWFDWRRLFNYSQRLAKATARQRERNGVRKRDARRFEIPACPGCGSNHYVQREGRHKMLNRQRYRCTECGANFLGEEL